MAEYTVVPAGQTIALPETLDDVTAAALGNPGLASWAALIGRAQMRKGEAVLVNGATGVAGQQAIQAAKYLGARRVIATGREATVLSALRELGADETILLTQPDDDLMQAFRLALKDEGVDIVLDYLWGKSGEMLLRAAAGHGSAKGEPRIRFIQIGSASGGAISLEAQILRSSGVELLGSGLGSLSIALIVDSLQRMYAATEVAALKIETQPTPLSQAETAWGQTESGRRVVFTI
jgi:NADPH2:quinone reductase